VFRVLDAVPLLHEAVAHASGAREPVWARVTAATLDDLAPPPNGRCDVLAIDFQGFRGEAFTLESASRFLSEAVRLGWRNVAAFGFMGGPRYVGTNLADSGGAPADGVVLEIFGRESGDFLGALLEGAEIWVYGQAQSHAALKADSGYLFMLQDALNTCAYAAHGGTISVWDTGSRFAVAGQNKVYLGDGATLAPGLEYLMSGGRNSLHVVMGLAKPDARGELSLRPRPYAGKFFMSGAAAGRVFVFDPSRALEPGQYEGNAVGAVTAEEWTRELAPFVAREAGLRGAPIRIDENQIEMRLAGTWQRWRYDQAFVKLVPGRGSDQGPGE
jgi:glutamate synthase domain-containing protein 3